MSSSPLLSAQPVVSSPLHYPRTAEEELPARSLLTILHDCGSYPTHALFYPPVRYPLRTVSERGARWQTSACWVGTEEHIPFRWWTRPRDHHPNAYRGVCAVRTPGQGTNCDQTRRYDAICSVVICIRSFGDGGPLKATGGHLGHEFICESKKIDNSKHHLL